MEHSLDDFNVATQMVFDKLFQVSVLSDDGQSVNGRISIHSIKLALFSHFEGYEQSEEDTWGNIITKVNAEKYTLMESFVNKLSDVLISQGLISQYFFKYDGCFSFTEAGYKRYLATRQKIVPFIAFRSKQTDEQENSISLPMTKPIVDIPAEEKEKIRENILKITYDYKKVFDKKANYDEIALRYLGQYCADLNRCYSLHSAEKDFDLSAVKSIVKSAIYTLYRENLIYYDPYRSSLIEITQEGIRQLVGDAKLQGSESVKPKVDTIRLVHISDLHFGSSFNDNTDNKDKIAIPGIKQTPFNSFQDNLKDIDPTKTFLIISGDLTSKFEEAGFVECKEELLKLNFNDEKIYIVPGNHDCEQKTEDFGMFVKHFSNYYNPFAKINYICDQGNKVFIVGFNSIHCANGEEVIFIDEEDMAKLKQNHDKLCHTISDFDKFIKIAVVHHNVMPHPSIEIKKYPDILNLFKFKQVLLDLGFNMILSGHKHQSLVERHKVYFDQREGDILLISTGSLCGKGGKNSFQVIEVQQETETKQIVGIDVIEYEGNPLLEFKEINVIKIQYP